MRNFAGASFFRLFELLLGSSNRGLKRSRWTHGGVEFERERHSMTGPQHGLAVEIFTLRRPGRHGWSLLVVKEYWWAGEDSKAIKSLRWARPTGGRRADILNWLRAQEATFGNRPFVGATDASDNDAAEELIPIDDAGVAGATHNQPRSRR